MITNLQETSTTILVKIFDCLSHSEPHTSALVENIQTYLALAYNPVKSEGHRAEKKFE